MIISLLFSLVVLLFLYSLKSSSFFLARSRYSLFSSFFVSILKSLFRISYPFLNIFVSLITFLLIMNVLGNFPFFSIPTLYYFYTVSISLTFWLSLIVRVFFTQLKDFIAHMLPFGSPVALIFFLPLIEIFSHLIRPFTLIIRLRTNLSSGHIMIFMFSFFSLSSFLMTSILSLVLLLLLVLELAISALQAYIFSSLTYIYVTETL